mmetsp:Transcript_11444/g.19953  ORF Transcript_11444/g.19953 Transcript_11444/m.19953 type:complete len:542 (-) Transcript_11444:67-1692(-)
MAANPLSPEIIRMALQVGDCKGTPPLEAALTERLMLISVASLKCSVALADPSFYDCPLIGCSDGFETLTGYSKSEVVGRNCRFLNSNACMKPQMRQALRSAVGTCTEFVGIVPNMRKNGEMFRNFLLLSPLTVGGHCYMIAIQADVTDIDLDLTKTSHLEDLRTVAERIFSANVDAWVQMQANSFETRLPVPYADIVKTYVPDQWTEAQGKFIKIAGQTVHKKNTFLHVEEDSNLAENTEFGQKRSASDPNLLASASRSAEVEADVSRADAVADFIEERCMCQSQCQLRSSSSDDRATHGCTKGSDCRSRSWKNRHLAKRLAAVGSAALEDDAGDSCASAANASLELTTAESAGEDVSIFFSESEQSTHSMSMTTAELPPGGALMHTQSYSFGTSAVTSLRYLKRAHEVTDGEVRKARLTLVAGQKVHLPASLDMETSTRKALRDMLTFSVDPPLPPGLSIQSQSGLLSGIAMEAQPRRLHMVTVSTVATGPGGLKLGLVPLARTSLLVRIVDLSTCKVSWIREAENDGDGDERILVEFKL